MKLAQFTQGDIDSLKTIVQPVDPNTIPYNNDPGFGNIDNPYPFVSALWQFAAPIILLASYLFLIAMVVGAAQYLTSAGNDEQITKAKRVFTNSTIGLIIVFGSYQFFTFLINQFGAVLQPQGGQLTLLVAKVYEIAILFSGIIFMVILTTGAFRYLISAGGGEEGLEKAKKQMTSAIIGIVLVAFAWVIGKTILTLLVGAGNIS